jgi:hypothetical protein
MAPKIWMWEVPMMPKDPTSAQGIHNQNAIDHVYLQAHNYPELLARIKGEAMDKQRLQQIEEYILGFFQRRQQSRVLAKDVFDSSTEYANADLVRAIEDLSKKYRLLFRYTFEGNDYISLTAQGVIFVGLEPSDVEDEPSVPPHPPKSATKNA